MEDLDNPIDDPNQPTVTEELLQIIEEFADYIDKFMFEIVTFLAVIDSSMGLVKDVLAMFGFAGWKMTFFPSFSFVVTIGVFLFGTNKRKGKRKAEAEQLAGLGEAMDMIEDVFEVMDDVMDEIEEVEGEAGALGLGDYSESEEDDDDNGDQNAINDKTNANGETSETNDAVEKIDVVTDENNQETAQQDANVVGEPPKSTLRKVIGIAIIAARIASKLAKKKQEDEQQDLENNSGDQGESGTGIESAGESMTGACAPPTDDKSKQLQNTSNQSTAGGILGEDGAALKNEAAGLVEAVKEDSIKTAEIVKAGSLGATSVVQGGTKQVLTSTGTLKVGHGLYREADFITGHLNKEGKAIGKSLEKDTKEKARQIKDNEVVKATGAEKAGTAVSREATFIAGHLNKEGKAIGKSLEKDTKEKARQIKDNEVVKATGAEKAGTAVSREATFIAGHLNQEAKKALHQEEQGGTSASKVTTDKRDLSSNQQGKKETATGTKAGKVPDPSKKSSAVEFTRQEGENKGKINNVSLTGTSKQPQSEEIRDTEQGVSPTCEAPLKHLGKSVSNQSKTGAICEEDQGAEKRGKEVGKDTFELQGNQEAERLPENTAAKGEEKELKQTCELTEIQDPERLIPEPLPGTIPDMASNVIPGAPGVPGATAAASQAKQGLQQTGKKSKGLLQIAMRLVRLIMRVAKKRGNSAPSSQNSSRRESTASGSGSLGGVPAKGKRSASGGGDGSAPDLDGAASSVAGMAGGGAKGGKIGAIVGIVVRLVRLASKLKGGQKDPPSSSMRSSKESIDQESDAEFFDCDEEFATQEIETQTEDRLALLSVATQTTKTDPGSTRTVDACDWGDSRDMRSEPGGTWTEHDSSNLTDMRRDPGSTWTERDSEDLEDKRSDLNGTWTTLDSSDLTVLRSDKNKKDLTRYVQAFQTSRAGPNVGSQTKGQEDMYQSCSKTKTRQEHYEASSQDAAGQGNNETRDLDMVQNYDNKEDDNQCLTSREQKGRNLQGLRSDVRESTRRNSTDSAQRITLKILRPNTDPSSTEATNNSLLLDIDAPVVLHSTRDYRSLGNDVNIVASGNREINEGRTSREGKRKSQEEGFSKNELPVRQGELFKCSCDLDEMERQTPQMSGGSSPRGQRTDRRDSSDGISDTDLSRGGSIVPYSSSSEENLEEFAPFLQRRRPTIVRFEDECEYSYVYDEDEPIASYQEMKKMSVLQRIKNQQRSSSGLKKYGSLENLDFRFPEDGRDDGPSAAHASGRDQESTRLLSTNEKPIQSNIFAARKSSLSGNRTSYFGDDEAEQPGALC